MSDDLTTTPTNTNFDGGRVEQIGDYSIISEIARGGMGVVYKARHRKLNRIAAVKMILGGQFSSPEQRQRFQVEAEAAAKLDHSGIVPVYEIGDHAGQAFFAMKYVEGGTLTEKIEALHANVKSGITILAKVARAVHHAHQRGVLHRDLKPSNILLDGNDQPLVTDLGLAKNTTDKSDLTDTGAVLGTPSYMAPEQAAGGQAVTTAADIYSLGAILYELLTGKPPHRRGSTAETLMSLLHDTPEQPRKLDRKINYELELICMKCIEREPDKRYGSASDFATDLESWLVGDLISLQAPSFGAMIGRWFKHNRRLSYLVFATMAGICSAMPLLFSLFTELSQVREAYAQFPNMRVPMIYKVAVIPAWISNLFFYVFLFAVFPFLGLLNALASQPKSLKQSVAFGVLTPSICAVFAVFLFGWLVFASGNADYSSRITRVLGNAVWPSENVTREQALESAINLYPGLQDIPEQDRADALSKLVVWEQISVALKSVFLILFLCVVFVLPVAYGTVIGFVLLQRETSFWLLVVRYGGAWIPLVCFVFVALLVGLPMLAEGDSHWAMRLAVGFIVTFSIACLSLRRWPGVDSE